MAIAESSSCNEDQGGQNSEDQCHEQDKIVFIGALSNATNVAKNKSFDHKICTENHPGGSSLRIKLEQRWNDLVLATSSRTPSPVHVDHGGSSEQNTGQDNPPQTSQRSSSASWLQNIYDRHTEPGRHYHTVVHLWEMFELLDIVISKVNAPRWYVPMAWSIFFHDAIYDPKSNRNEKDSAELFREFVDACMGTSMDKVTFNTAMTMILATEKHKVIFPGARSGSNEDQQDEIAMQKYFLDIDMAVLGKHRDAYFKYAALIRKEYEFVPHDVYCSKRAEILETFLVGDSPNAENDTCMKNDTSEKKYIFLTESFRGALEDRARENLRDEIELLQKNTIPG